MTTAQQHWANKARAAAQAEHVAARMGWEVFEVYGSAYIAAPTMLAAIARAERHPTLVPF